jgi:hypothetical protein
MELGTCFRICPSIPSTFGFDDDIWDKLPRQVSILVQCSFPAYTIIEKNQSQRERNTEDPLRVSTII